MPHPDLSEDVRADYEEARDIEARSPRGATALLRLALKKLTIALGQKGKDLNENIKKLVERGLPVGVQKSLDLVRVIGNNAVHPGQIDLRDDHDTATRLFGLVNFIAEKMIAEPREIEKLYGKLPETARDQIEARDKKQDTS